MNITSQQNRNDFSADSNGSKKRKLKKKLSALNTEHFYTEYVMAPQYDYVDSLHDQAKKNFI